MRITGVSRRGAPPIRKRSELRIRSDAVGSPHGNGGSNVTVRAMTLSFTFVLGALVAGKAVAIPVTAPVQDPRTDREGQVAEAALALQAIDMTRVGTDAEYAEGLLRRLDLLETTELPEEAAAAIGNLRIMILVQMGRSEEAKAAASRVLEQNSASAAAYEGPWIAAGARSDLEAMLTVIEQASRNVTDPAQRAQLHRDFDAETVWLLYRHFKDTENEEARFRLADSMVEMGWPGDANVASRDEFRMIALQNRLEQGDRQGASRLAATIQSPGALLELLLVKKYDGLLDVEQGRLQVLTAALAQHDRQTAATLESDPRNPELLLNRVQFLRSVGRNSEAVALLDPYFGDVEQTVALATEGMWLINEAAYALVDLGRGAEAVALMTKLVALDMTQYRELIGPSINHATILLNAGKPEEALAHASLLDRDENGFANAYGRMWMWSAATCALFTLGRTEEADSWLQRMRAQRDDNAAALMRGLLCANDLAAAEQLLITRLEGEDPESTIVAMQDYQPGTTSTEFLYQRLLAVRARPNVQAALARVGRVLQLPLARTYYGGL